MAKQEITGKAFEFACLNQLYIELKSKTSVKIRKDETYLINEEKFSALSEQEQKEFPIAANRAAKIIIPQEPNLDSPDSNDELELSFQPDKKGEEGDVRDIVCIRSVKGWELGISCKNNHDAVKHSRLSKNRDFGKVWLGYPVSKNYWNSIVPVFSELEELHSKKILWRDVENKIERYYSLPLRAFLNELDFIYKSHPEDVPEKLLRYMLGNHDFYKVTSHTRDKTIEVKPFNLYGNLGKSTKIRKSISRIPLLKMPTKIISMSFKKNSLTTIEVHFDEGWSLDMRLHSADSTVENSLKFDVQLIGVPANMGTRIEPWE